MRNETQSRIYSSLVKNTVAVKTPTYNVIFYYNSNCNGIYLTLYSTELQRKVEFQETLIMPIRTPQKCTKKAPAINVDVEVTLKKLFVLKSVRLYQCKCYTRYQI